MKKILLLILLLALSACAESGAETISEALPRGETVVIASAAPASETPSPSATATPTATQTPLPTFTPVPTNTPTATAVPNTPPRLVSVAAVNTYGQRFGEAVVLPQPPPDSRDKLVLSGMGPGVSLIVTFTDADANPQRAVLAAEEGSLTAALELPRDAIIEPLEGRGEPQYEIHFFKSRNGTGSVLEIGDLAEKELTLTIEDADGAATSERILLSRHAYRAGETRPAALAEPWFRSLQWKAEVEAGGLALDGTLADWIDANPGVAKSLYFVTDGQPPFSWQEAKEQPGLLQEKISQTEDGQPLALHYFGPGQEEQVVTTLKAPYYSRFRFVSDDVDPAHMYAIAAPRDAAISEEDLDDTAGTIARFTRHNPDIMTMLVENNLFFGLSPGELTGDTQSTLNGDTIWEDDNILADACGLYGRVIGRAYLIVRGDCLGDSPSYPGGVVIHELGHAVAFHMLEEEFPNLATALAAYKIAPPFQWPSVREELRWGLETWAHVNEAWFGYDSEFWWFWESNRPGTGRLFDVIVLKDGRSLRQFMFDLYGPPQDMDGNEYPEAAVIPR